MAITTAQLNIHTVTQYHVVKTSCDLN